MIQFDGSNDALTYTDIAAFDALAHLTYCFWYTPVTFATLKGVVGKGYTCCQVLQYVGADQSLTVQMASGASYGYSAASSFPTGEVHHVAMVYDGTIADPKVTLYKDSVALSLTIPSQFPATLAATAGLFAVGKDDAGSWFGNVRVGHLKVWAASLTVAEVKQEMQSRRPHRTANLLLWTPGEVSGTDYHQPPYAVTVADAPAFVADPPVGGGAAVLVS